MRSEPYANSTSQSRQELAVIPKWMTARKSPRKTRKKNAQQKSGRYGPLFIA
jgi:hypothetical protein